jgi:hypothetical protein
LSYRISYEQIGPKRIVNKVIRRLVKIEIVK